MSVAESTRPFAVITGASKGIGAEYARALAAQGYDLLLVARDTKQLEQMALETQRTFHVCAEWEAIDLAQPGASHALYTAARKRRPEVDLLVNNAGCGLYGHFLNMPLHQLQTIMTVNMLCIVESVRLFLPGMLNRNTGAIINVASVAGFFPVPYLAVYSATKSFLISFSEAIAQEIAESKVSIQTCCPGKTETHFHASAGYQSPDPTAGEHPRKVVNTSLAALDKGSRRITIGFKGMAVRSLAGIIPHTFLTKASGRLLKPQTDLH